MKEKIIISPSILSAPGDEYGRECHPGGCQQSAWAEQDAHRPERYQHFPE